MNQFDPTLPEWRAIFPAKLTARRTDTDTGIYLYSWEEVIQGGDGTYTKAVPGRFGKCGDGTTANPVQNAAREVNNAAVTADDTTQPIVWMRVRGQRGSGDVVYEFDAGLNRGYPTSPTFMIKITSGPSGLDVNQSYYRGRKVYWLRQDGGIFTPPTGSWEVYGEEVVVIPAIVPRVAAGYTIGKLEVGRVYHCRFYYSYNTTTNVTSTSYDSDDRTGLVDYFYAQSAGFVLQNDYYGNDLLTYTAEYDCQRLTLVDNGGVTNVNSSPFSVTGNNEGSVTVNFRAATVLVNGYMSISDQSFAGNKTFRDSVITPTVVVRSNVYYQTIHAAPYIQTSYGANATAGSWKQTFNPNVDPITDPSTQLPEDILVASVDKNTKVRFLGCWTVDTGIGFYYSLGTGWCVRVGTDNGKTTTVNYRKSDGVTNGTLTFVGGILVNAT